MKANVRFFCVVFLVLPSLAAAEKADWSLSVQPRFGFKYGEAGEYVFSKTPNYSDDTVSELVYEAKPELYGGLDVCGGWKRVFARVSACGGIPMNTGTVSDSDWFNNSPEYVRKADSLLTANHKTHYSESDCRLDYDFSFGVALGYDVRVFEGSRVSVSVRPFYVFDYSAFRFTAKDGEAWYGANVGGHYAAWNDEENRSASSGKFSANADYDGEDLSYRRWSVAHWIGLGASVSLPFKFTVDTGFCVAPYVYAESTDFHYLNNTKNGGTVYLDVTDGLFSAYKWNCGVSYSVSARNAVCVSATWFYLKTLRGDGYRKSRRDYENDDGKFFPNEKSKTTESGASRRFVDVSVGWKCSIF